MPRFRFAPGDLVTPVFTSWMRTTPTTTFNGDVNTMFCAGQIALVLGTFQIDTGHVAFIVSCGRMGYVPSDRLKPL